MSLKVIVTAPPYADYLDEIVRHPLVCGLRLNTVMPLKEGPIEAIQHLGSFGIPLWIDLKGRQLRVESAAIPPYTEVCLSHEIEVQTPVDIYFADGAEHSRVLAIKGRCLILDDGPRRIIGPGESVNIVHPSLQVIGTLTETDKAYLAAMKSMGHTRVMLSYVEEASDIEDVRVLLPGAEILLKIESPKGLAFTRKYGNSLGRLVAARGDLFIEVVRPHKILKALKTIIQADPDAILASRIFDTMAFDPIPRSAEISDVAFLLTIGYKTFMLGDALCFQRETLFETLNLLQAISNASQDFIG